MGLLSKLKSVLGLGDDEDARSRRSGDVGVTVERERDEADAASDVDAANEATVKGVDEGSADRTTTESATDEHDDAPAESGTTTGRQPERPAARKEPEEAIESEPEAEVDDAESDDAESDGAESDGAESDDAESAVDDTESDDAESAVDEAEEPAVEDEAAESEADVAEAEEADAAEPEEIDAAEAGAADVEETEESDDAEAEEAEAEEAETDEVEETESAETVEEADSDEAEEAEADDTDDEAEADESAEPAGDGEELQDIKGIGPAYADRLVEVGVGSIEELAEADFERVAADADLAPGRVQQWVDRAKARR